MTDDDDFDERRLVERVITRKPGADDEFIDRYGPVVARVLRKTLRPEDCDDCSQDVLLKCFENDSAWFKAWRGGSLSGFVAVTAHRVAIDLLRSRRFVKDGKTFVREVPLAPGFDQAGENESSGNTIGLPSQETIRQVASECLTRRHFEIFERCCRGENAKEIGEALNITPNNVYQERNRMKRALRECLKQRGLWPL